MSKYEPLRVYLADLDEDRWRATFADVETILGFPLPDSAHTHAAWWANSKQSSAAAWAWLDQGWRGAHQEIFAGGVAPGPSERALHLPWRGAGH